MYKRGFLSRGAHVDAVLPHVANLTHAEVEKVAQHLCPAITLAATRPLCAAALASHLCNRCLDLVALLHNVPPQSYQAVARSLARALELGSCPPITHLSIPRRAVDACMKPLLPHLAQLRHLTVTFSNVRDALYTKWIQRLLAALADAGHPGIEAIDVFFQSLGPMCLYDLLTECCHFAPSRNAGLAEALCFCKPKSKPGADACPPRTHAASPLLANLRSASLSFSSKRVGAALHLLPLAALTRLRVMVCFDGRQQQAACEKEAAATVAALVDAVCQMEQLHTLHLGFAYACDSKGIGPGVVAMPELQALASAAGACSTLRDVTLCAHWKLPSPYDWLLPLGALTALTHLAAPPCFELLEKLPMLSVLEFTEKLLTNEFNQLTVCTPQDACKHIVDLYCLPSGALFA